MKWKKNERGFNKAQAESLEDYRIGKNAKEMTHVNKKEGTNRNSD